MGWFTLAAVVVALVLIITIVVMGGWLSDRGPSTRGASPRGHLMAGSPFGVFPVGSGRNALYGLRSAASETVL